MFKKIINSFVIEYISISEMLEENAELIAAVEHYISDKKVFNRAFLPTIERYARYVYTLPASEAHHHQGSMGLFQHGLQTALNGVRLMDKKGVEYRDSKGYLDKKTTKAKYPKWRLALFIATLIHDAGKVFTMDVYYEKNIKGGKTMGVYWNPYHLTLYDFLTQANNWDYKVKWLSGRGSIHEKFNPIIFPFVAGAEATKWLGIEMNALIIDTITPMPSTDNILKEYVAQADRESAKEDDQKHLTQTSVRQTTSEHKKGNNTPRLRDRATEKSTIRVKTPAPQPETQSETQDIVQPPKEMPANEAAQTKEDKKEPTVQQNNDTTLLSVIDVAKAFKQACEQKEIAVNEAQSRKFVLVTKKAYWFNTPAIKHVFDKDALKNFEADAHINDKIKKLIDEGLFYSVDNKFSVRATVNGSSQILFAMTPKAGAFITGETKRFQGEINMKAEGKLVLKGELNLDAPDHTKPEKEATLSLTKQHEDETVVLTQKVIEALIDKSKGKPILRVKREAFDNFVKEECGQVGSLVKKALRKAKVTSLDSDMQYIKFSIAQAKDWLETQKK